MWDLVRQNGCYRGKELQYCLPFEVASPLGRAYDEPSCQLEWDLLSLGMGLAVTHGATPEVFQSLPSRFQSWIGLAGE